MLQFHCLEVAHLPRGAELNLGPFVDMWQFGVMSLKVLIRKFKLPWRVSNMSNQDCHYFMANLPDKSTPEDLVPNPYPLQFQKPIFHNLPQFANSCNGSLVEARCNQHELASDRMSVSGTVVQ
eukprot:scpid107666/ scgid18534/ 